MRVVHVATAFPRHDADPITPWLVRLLRELGARGVEAEVLAPAYRGGGAGRVAGIPIHRFRYAPAAWETLSHDQTVPDRLRASPARAALLPGYLAGGLLAAARLGRERPDVVHVHWPVPHALFGAALRAASGGRTAVVCSYYSVELNWIEHDLPWLRPFLRWSARTADGVTAISTATAARVRALAGRAARTIPFAAAVGSDRGASALEGGAGADREGEDPARPGRRPLEDEELRLLFVGRLVERKGVHILVEALARIVEHRPARLTVVGEGSWEERIRAKAEACGVASRVRLTGFVPEAELRRLYASCDIFVLPAVVDAKGDTEGLGVVLLEALRFGRPVIASDVGGIPDIVRPGRSGWLVPPGDPEALARSVLEVAADPGTARRRGEEGRRWAERRFSWDRIVGDVIEAYREAVVARRGPGGEGG